MQREPFAVEFGKFSKGIITALDRRQIDEECLTLEACNIQPYKHSFLATLPSRKRFLQPSDFTTGWEFPGYPGTPQPQKIVGMGVWTPLSGRDILVVAVYGNWSGVGLREGTCIFCFPNPDNPADHSPYVSPLGFLRGDAPVRFENFAMTNPDDNKRSNWLVVSSPYEFTRLFEHKGEGYSGKEIILHHFATQALAYQSRLLLTGIVGEPITVRYNQEIGSLDNFGSFKIGEEQGDPNLGFLSFAGAVFVEKTNSLWRIVNADPMARSVDKVVSQRGSCVFFPESAKGINCLDDQGLSLATGNYEGIINRSLQIPGIKADPNDHILRYDSQKAYPQDVYYHINTQIKNLGTTETPIWVLTLAQTAESEKDANRGTVNWYSILAGETAYQTFREQCIGYDPYWTTKIGLKLREETELIDIDVIVKLIEWTGTDPNDLDARTILAVKTIKVQDAATYWVTFDDPIYLKGYTGVGEKATNYMIEIENTDLEATLQWWETPDNTYANGKSSWSPTHDAEFAVWGFTYESLGFSHTPFRSCQGLKHWGAMLYYALDMVKGWEYRVGLEYKLWNPTINAETEWQNFGTYPSGGAISNFWGPDYYQIRFRVKLALADPLEWSGYPPFVSWVLATFSRLTDVIRYPAGLEYLDKTYFSGVKPNHDDTWVVNENGGFFRVASAKLSHFTVWRAKLYAGKTNSARVDRIKLDTDDDCKFSPDGGLIETGLWGINEKRKKELFGCYLRWREPYWSEENKSSLKNLYIDTGNAWIPITIAPEDIVEKTYNGDESVTIYAHHMFEEMPLMDQFGFRLEIAYPYQFWLAGTELAVPLFELQEFKFYGFLWPDTGSKG